MGNDATAKAIDDALTLREAADWFYDVCGLYEDEDLDPEDHLKVIERAFTSSDCDDFAWVVREMTGWQPLVATWTIKGHGFGHHALLRHPDGRMFDVTGFVDEGSLRKRYGAKVAIIAGTPSITCLDTDENVARIVGVVRALPHAPFTDPDFVALASRPVQGVDEHESSFSP